MAYLRKHVWALRVSILVVCITLIGGASVAFISNKEREPEPLAEKALAADEQTGAGTEGWPSPDPSGSGTLALEEVTPTPPPPSPAEEPKPATASPKPKAAPAEPKPAPAAEPPPPPPPSLPAAAGVYRGMGAWVDIFDYHLRAEVQARPMLEEMSRRGVRTVFLQSGRFKQPDDIINPAKVGEFIDVAHGLGIAVVAWYVPGFGHMDRDLRSSMAAIQFKSSSGESFDGFAPDIETGDDLIGGDRARFHAGIAEYSRRLRELAGGRVLGAIVVDAKNNERAPAKWAGFPWPEIGQNYDVVLPMAYWSVTKRGGCGVEYDTAQYMRDVYEKTTVLMGVERPMNIIGGIGNCISHSETAHMVDALLEKNVLGGGLYDFETQQANPARNGIWQELGRLNR